ncbi:mucin-5AC-like isoform X2 [Macrosteles quadrilineatus]|uniref:mucin-5AC-like isoform X2 n=1 Tax=Macrosteles quadrilineatus TaxID=74068 RepID=UPI0023E09F06|nr:mucin-5AC-like isoform X2 [Macrosteles quadrilineatus]
MKIWSVSCTLAVLLLVVTAQRRGSRRFDLSQASDSPAEDEDELSSTRSHRFERQRQSAEPDSDRGPISRSRSRTVETEAQVDSRRPGSRQRESVVDDSNLRQGSRRGKGLTLRSRSEPEEENHLSTERTRSRTNKEERRNGFPSRLDSDVISHTESATVRSQNINSRFSDKEKTKSRNENNFTRSSPVERRPLLPITSISPEDVTFPSRSRSRQTKAPEEAITSEPKGNSRNLQRSSEGTRLRSRTLEQNFPSRSSSRGTTRSRVPEVTSGTSTPSRTRSEFSPLRRKPIDLPGQDVESKIFSRRRNLAEEKVKTTIDDSSSKTGFVSDKVKSTLPVTSEGFTELPLYSSNAGTEEVINSDIPVNKQIENVVDALPTASNDALTLLPNEVLQSTLHANVRDRSKPQDSPLKNNDNTGLTKALHARSRGQERPSENESENVSRSRTRQRSKESDSESRKPTNRGRISTSEPAQGLSTARERFSPRSRGNLSNRESEQKEVDASNTRTRAQVRFPTRTSAESRGSAESSTEGSTVNRGRATSVNIATPTVELQTESSPIRSPSRSGGRRTLPKPTADLEPTAKPSRGRGQVKQGKLNDNEKGSGSGKDEDVSEDDNYPEVYKQLKKAGNGPKEILALLKAKKKQREAQQAQRRQQQQSATAEATTAATFFSDLNTEEDNVKPSIESSLRRRPSEKFSREAESSATERSSSRSASRQRSLTSRGSRNYNDLGKAEEEVLVNTQSVRTGTDSKDYKKLLEERKKKYSTIPRENDFDQDKENGVEIKSEKPSYSKDYLKSLNDLGLDPKTLGPTEPTTERERFVPSSRRTKSYSYRASTEQISDEVLNTSTFKPRYQLYQAKNRKKYLNKLGGKESLGSKEETSIESEVDQKVKKLRFGASSRPPYTPPRRVTTPLPPPRLSARRPGRFTPSSISVAFDKPDDQEPVTIQVFDLEARAPKLESASLVTEASSTAMTSSSETPSMEGSSEQSSSEASSEDSSVETSVTESPLENSVIDDETVVPMSISTSPATTTSTSTTTQPSTTTTTISAKTTISTTVKPKTTKIPSTTTTKKPVTTSTTQKPTTTTQKPTTTTQKPTTTTQKPTTTTQKPTTTTQKPTTTTQKPTTTTQKPTTTTQKPTTTTQKPTTTTQKPTTTTQKPTTTTQKPITTTQKSSTTTTKKPNTTTQKPTTTTKAPSTTTTTRKPTTQKPTTTTKKPPTPTTPKPTTKKPVSDKTPPSAPKPPQQQKPLTSSTSTTTTEAATTEDQLAARSNLVQKSEVSTVPEMILTSAQTLQPLTFTSSPSSTNRPQSESSSGYVAYALLPNNTLVRRVSARSTTPPTEVPFFVYGLYPNGTIVRKYPNGTVVPDDPSPESNELVAEVDPYNKKELSDILERDRPLAYLYPATSSTSLTPTSMASTEATSTTISSTTTTTESTTFSTTTTTTTQKPTTTTKKPTTTTKKPTQKPKPKAATTQKTVTTKATTTSTSPTPITTQQTTTTTTEIPQPSPTTTTTPEPTTTPQPTTTTPKPTTTLKPTTPKPTTPKPTTPKPTTPKPTTPKPTTPKPTTPKPSTPKPTTPKKPSTTTPTTTTTTTTTSTTTTTTPSTATEKNIEPMIVSGVESALSSPSSPKSETKENDEDCDICGDEVSSSSKATPSNGLSEDDVALLNNLLRLQPSDSERSASVDSSSSLPPSGPEDDDIANRIIQLAIERAQSTTASPVSVSVSTDGLDLQQLSSSPQPSFERDGKSIAPPMMDSMAVETSPPPKPGGKISLWVVPEGENEQTTKAPQKLSPEEEQVLTALLAAPQSPSSISVRDQLLLAELLAAGQNNNQGGQISTTKRPRKKKRPSSTPPPPPPPLSPLAALFGAGGRGGGLFASGAAPPTGSGEEGDASARPQQGGLLVNAAINITRAVSQFMGLVLQSAAQSFSTFLASRTRNFADYVARGGAIS